MTKRTALERAGIIIPEGAKVLGIKLPGEVAGKAPKRNKYGAKPTVYNGVRFASKAEAARAERLDGLYDEGLRYVRQPRFTLGCPENVYVADFLVWGLGEGVHVEDVKGHRTAKFARDVKLWRAYGPCQLWIVAGDKVDFVNGGRCHRALLHGTAGRSSEDA